MNLTWKDRWAMFRLMRTTRIARLESGIPTSWGFIDWMILTFPTWWRGEPCDLKGRRKYSWEEIDEFVRKAEENPKPGWLKWLWSNGWKIYLPLFLLFVLLFVGTFSHCQTTCPDFPLPQLTANTTEICHTAYISQLDTSLHIPRVVVYELTRQESLGCLPRASGFHAEGLSAKPADYKDTGYDLGHMMSAEDASWSQPTEYDSFSMVNVVPQLPGLNRQEWERLEEAVRAWAWQRGDVLVYVGPVIADHPAKDWQLPRGHVGIPIAFFKVIVDRKTGEVLSFYMPQKAEPKGDLAPWLAELQTIEGTAGIKFPVDPAARKKVYPADRTLWSLDLPGWRKAHKTACGR